MIQLWEVISIYILALIGLATIVVIAAAIWLSFNYEISFSVKTGKSKKLEQPKGG